MNIYKNQTNKPLAQFITDFTANATKRGFLIHNADKMSMAAIFGHHNISSPAGFDLHMLQLCKPEKASKSLFKNPERSVLMPKFVMLFTKEGKTQIRFLYYSQDAVRSILDDEEFPQSLDESYKAIIAMIEDSMQLEMKEAC